MLRLGCCERADVVVPFTRKRAGEIGPLQVNEMFGGLRSVQFGLRGRAPPVGLWAIVFQRVDSKDPFVAGDEYIRWLLSRGRDPRRKRLIASDGLDVEDILALHEYFQGRIRFSAGWGTLLTNDFRGCHPRGERDLEPISLVCKLMTVQGRPAVKLSDNPRKATGPENAIERYRRVFGTLAASPTEVLV